jgi:glucosamine--fructose-6-phosphate aminotransferase (isomerizing)
MAGDLMLEEIRYQPDAIRSLLEGEDAVGAAAARLVARRPHVVRLVGHGTSDNAATYGVYAFGLLAGWTALRDSISLTVYYDTPLDFGGSAVIALSQSGETPDVVEYVERARAKGALTVALTNDESSPLAGAADCLVPLRAGPERAVAATKTYMNSLAALALLAGHAAGRGRETADRIRETADCVAAATEQLERPAASMASAFAFVGRMFVIGRDFEFATAREIALKLQEACRVAADALTATDLAHGPVNAVAHCSRCGRSQRSTPTCPPYSRRRARQAGATLVATGAAADHIEGAAYAIPTPAVPEPVLAPLVSVVPGQLFVRALALAKGYDPDRPTHLSKVTLVP